MLQNELLSKTQSSYSLSTIYLSLLHFGRFLDELFKPYERLKLAVVQYQKLLPIETAQLFTSDDPRSCFTLACVKAREPFDAGELLN